MIVDNIVIFLWISEVIVENDDVLEEYNYQVMVEGPTMMTIVHES